MYFGYTNPDKIESVVEFRACLSACELEYLTPQEVIDKICVQLMDGILPKLKNVLEKRRLERVWCLRG